MSSKRPFSGGNSSKKVGAVESKHILGHGGRRRIRSAHKMDRAGLEKTNIGGAVRQEASFLGREKEGSDHG